MFSSYSTLNLKINATNNGTIKKKRVIHKAIKKNIFVYALNL